jgi:hypothetical protein
MKAKSKTVGRRTKSRGAAITTKKKTNKPRLNLKVGEPWNEEFSVEIQDLSTKRKDYVNVLLGVGFVTLLFALSANAMMIEDRTSLAEILSITKMGLIFVAVWAGGKAALRVLSGWQNHR